MTKGIIHKKTYVGCWRVINIRQKKSKEIKSGVSCNVE